MAATEIINQVTMTEEEVKAYFDANPAQFASKEQVKAKHILVDEEALAQKIAAELAEGKSFEDAAKEYSTCPSKENGGDLGYFGRGQMVPEFEKAAFEGTAGELVGPIKTQFGYHLIQIDDKKEETAADFAEIKDQLTDTLLQQKKQTVYMQTVKELEEKYGVERKLQ